MQFSRVLTFISPTHYYTAQLVDSMSYRLDLSPAQAPLNCFGSRIISRDTLSSRILARIRPRHYRKTDYNGRLRLGDIAMSEAWEIFGGCQHSLSYEKRLMIQAQLNKCVYRVAGDSESQPSRLSLTMHF